MRLILLRHAKSDWSEAGQDDHARPLNARGRAGAAAIGGWLRSRGYVPTRVLCSDAVRTRQTLEGLALEGAEVELRPDLYGADAATILALATTHGTGREAGTLLIVGHNPGMGEAARDACATPPSDPDFARYPTGACIVIDTGIPGRCLDFTTPRALT